MHKRWCEYSLYSFSLHQVSKNLILLSAALPDRSVRFWNFCQCLFRVADLPISKGSGSYSANALPCYLIHMIIWSNWHCCFLFSDDHTLSGYSVPGFQLLISSVLLSNFLLMRSPFYWLQLLSSVFTPTLTYWSLSLLFRSFPVARTFRKFCVQQGSYFRLRGTERIQSFCFTPICTSVIVFIFFSITAAFHDNLFRMEPGYSYVLCVSKGFYFIFMNQLLFCWNFPPTSDFHFISTRPRSGFILTYLHCRGSDYSSVDFFSEDRRSCRRNLIFCTSLQANK